MAGRKWTEELIERLYIAAEKYNGHVDSILTLFNGVCTRSQLTQKMYLAKLRTQDADAREKSNEPRWPKYKRRNRKSRGLVHLSNFNHSLTLVLPVTQDGSTKRVVAEAFCNNLLGSAVSASPLSLYTD